MDSIIFNKDFEVEEVTCNFSTWLQNEHDKRMTKKGKLFEVLISEDSIHYGDCDIMAGSFGPSWMSPFEWDKIHDKYVEVVSKCKKILEAVCHDNDTYMKEEKTGGLARRIIVYRPNGTPEYSVPRPVLHVANIKPNGKSLKK